MPLPVYGDAGALQQTLHAAVLAATPVQNDEGAVDTLTVKTLQQIVADIDTEGIHTGRLQCLQHRRTGFQRYFALGAFAAEQHGDPAKRLRVTSRMQGAHGLFPRGAFGIAKQGTLDQLRGYAADIAGTRGRAECRRRAAAA